MGDQFGRCDMAEWAALVNCNTTLLGHNHQNKTTFGECESILFVCKKSVGRISAIMLMGYRSSHGWPRLAAKVVRRCASHYRSTIRLDYGPNLISATGIKCPHVKGRGGTIAFTGRSSARASFPTLRAMPASDVACLAALSF
jgi:hypothetical protein